VNQKGHQLRWEEFDQCGNAKSISLSAFKPKEGDQKEAMISSFLNDPLMCPIMWFCRYIRATQGRIVSGDDGPLFVSSHVPVNSACKDSIGLLFSSVLRECRVDCRTYSTRSVSRSVVLKARMPLADVLGAANRASSRTLFHHYRSTRLILGLGAYRSPNRCLQTQFWGRPKVNP
jgi:hypothetical protein